MAALPVLFNSVCTCCRKLSWRLLVVAQKSERSTVRLCRSVLPSSLTKFSVEVQPEGRLVSTMS